MSQVLKGNPAGAAMSMGKQAGGTGMVVGVVVNKPSTPTQIAPAAPTGVAPQQPGMVVPVPTTLAPQQQPLLNPQQMAAPQQQSAAAVAVSSLVAPPGQDLPGGEQLQQQPQVVPPFLANTKEKTPMCLINELARYNKIPHQYTLVDEQGPAHKKTFYVKLKLGEEEYNASGPSIKKAQHAAADIALQKTQFKHPPPKPPKNPLLGEVMLGYDEGNITPTVELNALAMKRGEPAIYRPIEPQRPQYYPPPNFDFRGMYNQRYHYPRFPRMFYVSLKVGQREFIGEGNTRQAARHNAAAKALKVLRNLPLPNNDMKKALNIEEPGEPVPKAPEEEDDEDKLKSEISLVHEIGLKRNLPVNFEVTRESGPPHMRNFVTRCSVGEFLTEGEGNSKKLSKKRAAEKMLEELRKLPSLPPSIARPKPKGPPAKKKNRNLIKMQKASPDYGVGINPISRLIQIQQAKKEKEPVYTLIVERGLPRRREFVMQVSVGVHQVNGVGPNKKLAKRAAAEAMLQTLGYSRPSPQPSKPAIKSTSGGEIPGADKRVTFIDQDSHTTPTINEGSLGRQLAPGVLLMPDGNRHNPQMFGVNQQAGQGMGRGPGMPLQHGMEAQFSTQTTSLIAKELLEKGSSPTAEAILRSGAKPLPAQASIRPKQQLLYLADVLGFQVQFTDFPKGNNKNEYFSLVSLSTNPAQVMHGVGPTIEASHDMTAITALKMLAEMGIDAVQENKAPEQMGAGDGPHVKTEGTEKQANSNLGGNVATTTAVPTKTDKI